MRRAAGMRQPLYSCPMPATLESPAPSPPPPLLPRAPVLAVSPRHAAWLDEHGALARLSHDEAAERLAADGRPPYVCHAKATARRLGLHPAQASADVLELFALCTTARQAVPTVRGSRGRST